MSVRSGKETKRTPMELYKGYRVIKVTKIEYHRSLWDNSRFDKNWIDSKEVHFDFCKEGNEKLPSQDYNVKAKNIEDCKEAIDKFLNGDAISFSYTEYGFTFLHLVILAYADVLRHCHHSGHEEQCNKYCESFHAVDFLSYLVMCKDKQKL